MICYRPAHKGWEPRPAERLCQQIFGVHDHQPTWCALIMRRGSLVPHFYIEMGHLPDWRICWSVAGSTGSLCLSVIEWSLKRRRPPLSLSLPPPLALSRMERIKRCCSISPASAVRINCSKNKPYTTVRNKHLTAFCVFLTGLGWWIYNRIINDWSGEYLNSAVCSPAFNQADWAVLSSLWFFQKLFPSRICKIT